MMENNIRCQFQLQPEYFDYINQGKKIVEGRIAKEKYLSLRGGDCIEFCSGADRLVAVVEEVTQFASFKEYIQHYSLVNCLPGIDSVEQGVKIYYGFPGYQEQEKLLGVVGIKFKVIVSNAEK